MSQPLDGCSAKIRRANKHLKELDGALDTFAASHPYKVAPDFDRVSGHFTLRLASVENPPVDVSVIVGDIAHNLHSALDHLVCQLLIHAGGTDCDDTMFPIYTDPSDYTKAAERRLKALTQAHQTAIERLQPYHAGNDPLRSLYDLSVIDKHRTPNVLTTVLLSGGLGISLLDGWNIYNMNVYGGTEVGAVVAEARLVQTAYKAELEVNPKYTVEVRLEDGRLLLPVMTEIRDFVRDNVFPKFNKDLGVLSL